MDKQGAAQPRLITVNPEIGTFYGLLHESLPSGRKQASGLSLLFMRGRAGNGPLNTIDKKQSKTLRQSGSVRDSEPLLLLACDDLFDGIRMEFDGDDAVGDGERRVRQPLMLTCR